MISDQISLGFPCRRAQSAGSGTTYQSASRDNQNTRKRQQSKNKAAKHKRTKARTNLNTEPEHATAGQEDDNQTRSLSQAQKKVAPKTKQTCQCLVPPLSPTAATGVSIPEQKQGRRQGPRGKGSRGALRRLGRKPIKGQKRPPMVPQQQRRTQQQKQGRKRAAA